MAPEQLTEWIRQLPLTGERRPIIIAHSVRAMATNVFCRLVLMITLLSRVVLSMVTEIWLMPFESWQAGDCKGVLGP